MYLTSKVPFVSKIILFQVEIGLARTRFHRSLALERGKNDNPILNGKGRDDDDQGSEGEEDRDPLEPVEEVMKGTSKSYSEIIQVIQTRKIIQL